MSRIYIRNIVIFALIFCVLGEFLFRKRYSEPFRNPPEETLAIQKFLVLDDTLGFHWKENVSVSEGILFADQDSETWPLSTDQNGFINPPEQIVKRTKGVLMEVVGLGDSFMEHAAYPITDFFSALGFNYYNFAIHRQSPPQYFEILKNYASSQPSKIVLLGITENDFSEIDDYLSWHDSGLDWFTFHSGTWCGPPLQSTKILRIFDETLPGYSSLLKFAKTKTPVLGNKSIDEDLYQYSKINDWLELINKEVAINEDTLIVVLIPSKESVLSQRTDKHVLFDGVIKFCQDKDIHFVDLYPIFRNHENPSSLYYPINGHWNSYGIGVALDKVVELSPNILMPSKE